MVNTTANGVDRFRQFIYVTFGIQHDDSKLDILRDVMQERKLATEVSADTDYLTFLSHSLGEQEAVARRITISETYFFRLPDQFEALMRTALPERIHSLNRRTV